MTQAHVKPGATGRTPEFKVVAGGRSREFHRVQERRTEQRNYKRESVGKNFDQYSPAFFRRPAVTAGRERLIAHPYRLTERLRLEAKLTETILKWKLMNRVEQLALAAG